MVRGVNEKGWESGGFLALALLQARYDANTAASLLQTLKNHQGILKGITEWEVRVDGLKMKHNEDISSPIKFVVLVGMLSKEYQDICFQQATGISSEAATQEKYDYEHGRIKGVNDYPSPHGYCGLISG